MWGGYWALWDTMHFEYRPEQIFACDFAFSETERFYTDADIERLEAAEKEREAQNKKETEEQPANDSSAQNDQNSENAEDKSVQNKKEEAQ